MPRVWVPVEALVEGTLPAVCLVCGVDGAPMREHRIEWGASPSARGSALATPGGVGVATTIGPAAATVMAALDSAPFLTARIPLTGEALERIALWRYLGLGVVAALVLGALVAGAAFDGVGFGAGIVCAFVCAMVFGGIHGRRTGLALLKREGNAVLLEVPSDRAAAAIAQAFPKSVDAHTPSVG
jgi:hypothetical protein